MLENNHSTVLLVEGKRNGNCAFSNELSKRGYEVCTVENGTTGLSMLAVLTPMLIVINAATLRTNGVRIAKRFRNCLPECPILLIVDNHFNVGEVPEVNAVLTLPFTVQKLINRMQFFQKNSHSNIYTVGPLQLNISTNIVTCNGKESHLTPRQSRLLLELMKQPGKLLLRDTLFQRVWETAYTGDTRTLDVHISWLRKAIETDPHHPTLILNVRAKGYKLNL